ncbi:MAG: hypothetical protein WBP90_16095 [Terracidiphilus sp.]
MIIFFLKQLLQARSNRMSLLAAGLVFALPMAACIALAQEPTATTPTTTSKMTTPEGYSAHHTVDVSGRMSDAVGSGAMYDTMVNLQSGPRVSGETLELHKLDSNKHAWVDDARASGSGFGGDPYNFAKLSMSKAKLYEFNGIFRRDRQYFDYDLLGNPNLPRGLSLPIGPSTAPTSSLVWQQPQHSSVMTNSVRRMTDTNVTLYPQSTFSIHLGYSQNIMQGPSLLPVRSGGVIKYNALMELYQRHSTDEYSIAIDWKPVKGTTVTYEQRIHHYKENSYITLDPNGFQVQEADGTPAYLGNWDFSSNASTSTTTAYAPYSTAACSSNSIASATTFLYPSSNGGKPIIDPSCSVVTGYLRTYPIRTTMPSEILRFQSTSIKNLIMNGQFSYSKMNMNMPSFMDNAWGLLAGTATTGATRDEYNSAVGVAKREVYNAEYGVIWEVAKNFDLEDQITLSANGQPGNVNTSGYTKLVTPDTAGSETINYTGTLTSSVTNSGIATGETYGMVYTYFGNEQLVNNLTASWTVTPKANLAFTYRYGNRNIGLNLNVTSPARTIFAITEQGGILNAAYRVTNNWDINGTVEAMYDDNAFTTMSPRQLRHYRVHTKFRPTNWATFNASYTDMERHNNTQNTGVASPYGPLNHVDYSRTAGLSGMLTPSEHLAIDFDYIYSDVYTATNICYTNQDSGFLTGTTSPYFAGAASLTPSGAPSTCVTSATNSTPTQWYGRAFMHAPTQHGSVGVDFDPNEKVKYGIGYRMSSVAGSQFFTDARAVNGSLESTYQTPYLNVAYTMHPGLIWKAEYNYFGYGEGGPSGAQNCTLTAVANVTAANIVPCASMSVSTGMNEGNAGATAPRDFHASNITVGFHYEF